MSGTLWDWWVLPDGSEIKIWTDWPRAPQSRGGLDEARAALRAAAESIVVGEEWRSYELDELLSSALDGLGWRLVGHSVVFDLAPLHLRAAVRQVQECARLLGQVREAEADDKALTKLFMPGILRDRATEHGRNAVVLAAACLEAYINAVARDEIAIWSSIDGLRVREKWIVVAAMISGRATFDVGSEPFQSLDRLFRRRNQLMHPTPTESSMVSRGEAWMMATSTEPNAPDWIVEGRVSCLTVRRVILKFAELTSRSTPRWCAEVPATADPMDDAQWANAAFLAGALRDPDFPPLPNLVNSRQRILPDLQPRREDQASDSEP